MLNKLLHFNKENGLFNENDRLAIAVSGGVDSVCTAHLFNALKISFVIVHCNFKLRADASDKDEEFVKQLAEELEFCTDCYTKSFDTALISANNGNGIQETARDLRYTFFDELKESSVYDKLITAHQKDDNRESFVINLYRVSGIKGLSGIPVKRDYIIRPLMAFSKEEIVAYMQSNKIAYRQDESNASDIYLRNKIRHHILPVIEEQLDGFAERLDKSIQNIQSSNELLSYYLAKTSHELCDFDKSGDLKSIDLQALMTYPQQAVVLYSILDKFGFTYTHCKDIIESEQTGSRILSSSHIVVKDRIKLVVSAIKESDQNSLLIDKEGTYQFNNAVFALNRTEKGEPQKTPFEQLIDFDQLPMPLELRYWEEGDYIYPMGMNHRKKLSDLFIDAKVNLIDKHKYAILAAGKEVFWLVGLRISDKIKLTKKTVNYCTISFASNA
ncbi:MAG: tRNA lysidine(34) synthetase TilS [Bacteroidia bacterium]